MTTHPLALLALPPVLAVLHRIRGGGIVHVPGLSRLAWIAINSAIIALLCWLGGAPRLVAVALGFGCYTVWCLPGWEKELCAAENAVIPADQVIGSDWTVRSVWWLSGGRPVLACYLRAALPLLPGVAALEALALVWGIGTAWDAAPLALIPIAFWPIYLAAWQSFRRLGLPDQCVLAEPGMGAVLGANFAISAFIALAGATA